MNIFFDSQIFSQQNYGGISRYYAELIKGINQSSLNTAILPVLYSENIHLKESGIVTSPFLPKYSFYKKQIIQHRLNHIYNVKNIFSQKFDVYHATYYDPSFVPYVKGYPVVITVLDMIHEKFSNQFRELDYRGAITKNKRILANRADKIISISESTKNDIINIFDVDPHKIEVIHLGSSFELADKPSMDTREPFLLYVGRRERYKNFDGFLMAINHTLKVNKIKLICAGGDPFTKNELYNINSLGVENYVEYRYIDDISLKELYKNAIGLVFPSMYEGFGIPVLEAFACGCPCVLSNSSSLPEVAGDAAIYMDPFDRESMKSSVENLLSDSVLRNNLIKRGYDRLKNFSWKNTVNDTIKVYSELI